MYRRQNNQNINIYRIISSLMVCKPASHFIIIIQWRAAYPNFSYPNTSVNRTRNAGHAPLLRSLRAYIRCALIRCITRSTRAIDPRWLLRVLVLLPLGRKERELC